LAEDQKGATEIGTLPSNDRYHAKCAWGLRSSYRTLTTAHLVGDGDATQSALTT
jgi:hypothetical protein